MYLIELLLWICCCHAFGIVVYKEGFTVVSKSGTGAEMSSGIGFDVSGFGSVCASADVDG